MKMMYLPKAKAPYISPVLGVARRFFFFVHLPSITFLVVLSPYGPISMRYHLFYCAKCLTYYAARLACIVKTGAILD